jgi:N-acetylmuramoyl-L-alanine amidase
MRIVFPLLLTLGFISFWSFTNTPTQQKVIVIDAGHGGKDPGFHQTEASTAEKDLTLKLSARLTDLAQNYPQLKIYNTRSSDEFVDLKTRAKIAQVIQPQLFISLHVEGGAAAKPGINLMTPSETNYQKESEAAAQLLVNKLGENKALQLQPQIESFNSFVLKNAHCPALLLNIGNLSSAQDLSYWQQDENIDAFCHAILSALSQA